MPHYRITITLKNLSVHTGIRELLTSDIDSAWEIFKGKALEHYGEGMIEDFSCVMVSKYDDNVKVYIERKGVKMHPVKMRRHGNYG